MDAAEDLREENEKLLFLAEVLDFLERSNALMKAIMMS